MVRSEDRVFFVPVDRIDWIEAAGKLVRIRVAQVVHELRDSLSALEKRLDPKRFVRIHRSRIINLDRVQELQPLFHGDYVVLLKDGTSLKLSRRYRSRFEASLGGRL